MAECSILKNQKIAISQPRFEPILYQLILRCCCVTLRNVAMYCAMLHYGLRCAALRSVTLGVNKLSSDLLYQMCAGCAIW